MSKSSIKLVVLSVALIAMLAGSSLEAQTVWMNAVGASSQWKTWGVAASFALPAPNKSWSKKKGAVIRDTRGGGALIPDQSGNIWIVWSGPDAAPTNVAAYLTVDSVVGQRTMFAGDATPASATKLVLNAGVIGTAGDNQIPGMVDSPLPAAVAAAIDGKPFDVGFSEVRPEDAKRATAVTLANPLYGGGPVSNNILSSISTGKVFAVDFNISGNDPIDGFPVRQDLETVYIGASPVVVFINDTDTNPGVPGDGSFGDRDAIGYPVFQDIHSGVLAGFYDGTLSLTRDVNGDGTLPAVTTTAFMREPLSGTYNTFEYNIPGSAGLGSSQENGVTTNPLNEVAPGGGLRQRAIGTGEMTGLSGAGGVANSLGYSFWGWGNFKNIFTTTRYLKVDGVDPLQDKSNYGYYPFSYQAATFKNVKNGTYPIWGTYIAAVDQQAWNYAYFAYINAVADLVTPFFSEYVPWSQMPVFRSHYTIPGISVGASHNGNIAGIPASGGQVGGRTYPKQADIDYYSFSGMEIVEKRQ
ncbi:MAG: hypothetical protein JW793_07045 [Acidobacteria bacterium]|nr:hypothetical protein [Acidobacteriota bacterium]